MEQNPFLSTVSELIQFLKTSQDESQLEELMDLNDAMINFPTTFYGTVENNILLFKRKIIKYLQSINESGTIDSGEAKSINILKLIQRKLATINKDLKSLLQEGILTLYIELNDLRGYCKSKETHSFVKKLVDILIEELGNLLRQYFIFHEYEKQKRMRPKGQRKSSFSLRRSESSPTAASISNYESSIDENILRDIEMEISKKSLSELFEEQVRKEEMKMTETLEICRICFQQIPLNNLQKHVKNCAKKSQLQLNLQEKNIIIAKLEEKLKDRYKESCKQMIHEPIDEQFRNICKLILNPSRKNQKSRVRRNSLADFKSESNFGDRIEVYIEEYLEEYQHDELLDELLTNYRQKGLLEKNLNNLEMQSLYESRVDRSDCQSSERSEISNVRRQSRTEKRIKTNIFQQGDKSRFHNKSLKSERYRKQKDEKRSKSNSAASIEKNKMEKEKSLNKSKKFKSKGSLSRKCEKVRSEQFDFTQIKQYQSLQLINISENKQVDSKSHPSLKDFQILSFLGSGAFGKVYMARRKETKDIYALKIVKFPDSSDQNKFKEIKNEHEILKKIVGDHLAKAHYLFSEHSCHIFVLEFMPGGDLRKLLTQEVYFQEETAKLYIAEIILAIQHLHKYNIIHRDLKPENLVIDRKGHLKLTDFGLSSLEVHQILDRSRKQEALSFNDRQVRKNRREKKIRTAMSQFGVQRPKVKIFGTPDYLAPELIYQTSLSNFSIDWWSLGVIAYELIIGSRPFGADTIDQIIENITKMNITWPEVGYEENMISPEAKDFIEKLLHKDFSLRLGAKGVDELKGHPFLEDVDWGTIKSSDSVLIPSNMVKKSDIIEMEEDSQLREEIQILVRANKNKVNVNELELESVIRFDLLKSQTIEKVEKKQEKSFRRLKKLKTLKDITHEQKQNILL